MRQVLLLYLFYRCGNSGTQIVSDRAEIQTKLSYFESPNSFLPLTEADVFCLRSEILVSVSIVLNQGFSTSALLTLGPDNYL